MGNESRKRNWEAGGRFSGHGKETPDTEAWRGWGGETGFVWPKEEVQTRSGEMRLVQPGGWWCRRGSRRGPLAFIPAA